jgi:flagellin
VSSMLTQLESLVDSSANDAGLSAEEKDANQLQIDSILQTIDRIANSTSFEGIKLLNGTYSYTTSGVDNTELSDVKINAAKIPQGGQISVTVDVVQSAQTAVAYLSAGTGNTLSGTSLTVEVAGAKGVQQFTFSSGTTAADIVTAINTFTGVTGVSATASTTYIKLNSTEFGSSQFVSANKVAGDGAYDNSISTDATSPGSDNAKDYGRDASVTINGQTATADGLTASTSTASLDLQVTLAAAQNTDGATSSFDITGGGATFSLSPKVDLAGKVSLGIDAVTTGQLGSSANGFLSSLGSGGSANVVTGDVESAQAIVRDAVKQVSSLRGRLGAFQKNTVGSTIRALGVALENTSAAESQIRDTDFASETANLSRAQILVSAATSVLSLANSQPQSVLRLLQ